MSSHLVNNEPIMKCKEQLDVFADWGIEWGLLFDTTWHLVTETT